MASKIRTDYVRASVERLDERRFLIERQAYSGSIYLSGLAAESMVQAFIVGKGDEIKGHNRARLAVSANLARRLKTGVREQVNAAISEASPIWKNLYRYSSQGDLECMALEGGLRFQVGARLVRFADLPENRIELWSKRLYNLAALVVQE